MSTPAAWVHGLATDLRIALAFSTRLPVGQSVPIGGDDVARASWALPIAGLLVGGLGALAGAHALRSTGAYRRPVGSGRAAGAAKHRRASRAGRDRARARPRSTRGDHWPHPVGVRVPVHGVAELAADQRADRRRAGRAG